MLIDIGPVLDQKLEAMGRHACQMYEWMPFIAWGVNVSDVPDDPVGRLAFLRTQWDDRLRRDAERFRSQLIAAYGAERGSQISYAEAFEVCELGAPLTQEARRRLFSF